MKWSYFLAACILAWLLLLSYGAPVFAVAIGTAAAASFTWFQNRK
ncbi:MAG: hypothetical protein ABJF23_27620 [Bryobacteraceae bacterium]